MSDDLDYKGIIVKGFNKHIHNVRTAQKMINWLVKSNLNVSVEFTNVDGEERVYFTKLSGN
jgi:hypothetical protein